MKESINSVDWALVRSFCAVADTGSLSGAARQLGQSQPTIGRHIKAMETTLGVELFRRDARGLELTATGLELLHYGIEMQQAANGLSLAAAGKAEDLRGTVRITASVVFSQYLLPKIVARIRQKLPEVSIEIVATDSTENLIFREADIAIRMYRPTQLDVITQHVKDQALALYANRTYLDRVGRPSSLEGLQKLDFVGFDRNDLMIRAMRDFGMDVDREFFPVRCDNQAVHWRLVCEGCGIGAAQTVVGDAEPLVEKLNLGVTIPAIPIWLAAPEVLRSSIRVRRVWDILVQELS